MLMKERNKDIGGVRGEKKITYASLIIEYNS